MGRAKGFTLLELLIVIAIAGIVMSIGFLNLRPLSGDLRNNASRVAGNFKQARAKAMSTTSAYRVVKTSATTIRADWAENCQANNWTTDEKFNVTLDNNIRIESGNRTLVCFTSKGIATSNPVLTMRDERGKRMRVEVFLGGAVEIR